MDGLTGKETTVIVPTADYVQLQKDLKEEQETVLAKEDEIRMLKAQKEKVEKALLDLVLAWSAENY